VRSLGRHLLRYGAAGAFVLAVVGWPLLGLTIAAVLVVLVRLEPKP
jgi:hypothetical protein